MTVSGAGRTDAPAAEPAALVARYQTLAARLERADGAAKREDLKREIAALYRAVEHALAELGRLRDDLRGLVERHKELARVDADASVRAPAFSETRPAPQADHLGASTYVEKGWSLISLGDYDGAVRALERALQLSPGEVRAQSLLGWAQMLREDYDEALGTFSRVLMKEPADALARVNVGYICLKKGIFGEAIEHLSRAIRLDTDRKATLYAHYYLGLVYLEREMYEDAAAFFRRSLEIGPNLIEAYLELGRAQWLMGEREAARRTWADGYDANKYNPWGKRCREMLELVTSGGEPPRKPSS